MSTRWSAGALLGAQLGTCVLERAIGAGGMGAVYLARQDRPRRQVAVKVLRPLPDADRGAQSVFLMRFRREADATAALDHANIVPLYEFGEQDGIAYLVMPYLADGSLADVLARSGQLSLGVTISYLAQAAAALDHAHAHGIIHRDVKPSNLLLHADGRLLLADFGIARPLQTEDIAISPEASPAAPLTPGAAGLTRAGALLGTPYYMAPEQIRAEPVSPATDIYALGAVAYTMLAGQPPFSHVRTEDVLRQHLTGQPPSLRMLRRDVPPGVEEAILWALEKAPADRPASARAFVAALAEASGKHTAGALAERAAPTGNALAMSAYDAPTVYDAGESSRFAGMPPTHPPEWPAGGARDDPPPGRPPRSLGRWRVGGLVAAIGIVLVMAFLLGGLAGAVPGWLLGGGPGPVTHVNPTATATATATPTVMPTPTATPVVNWLSVSPASVSLGCGAQTKSTRVLLRNLGPSATSWSAAYNWLGGISVSPTSGTLESGQSATIKLTNTTLSWFGGSGKHDFIEFRPGSPDAGVPASVSYTTQAC